MLRLSTILVSLILALPSIALAEQINCENELSALLSRGLAGQLKVRIANLNDGSSNSQTINFVTKPNTASIYSCEYNWVKIHAVGPGEVIVNGNSYPTKWHMVSTGPQGHYQVYFQNNRIYRDFEWAYPEYSGFFMDRSVMNSLMIAATGIGGLDFTSAESSHNPDGYKTRFFTMEGNWDMPWTTNYALPVSARGTKAGVPYEVTITENTLLDLAN